MDKLNNIFQNQTKLQRWIKVSDVEQILRDNWVEIFGNLSKDMALETVKKNSLILGCRNPLWVTEIEYHKPLLLERINKLLKGKTKIYGFSIRQVTEKAAGKISSNIHNKNLNLEEKIKAENQNRVKQGQTLCQRCGEVFSFEAFCTVCLAKAKAEAKKDERLILWYLCVKMRLSQRLAQGRKAL